LHSMSFAQYVICTLFCCAIICCDTFMCRVLIGALLSSKCFSTFRVSSSLQVRVEFRVFYFNCTACHLHSYVICTACHLHSYVMCAPLLHHCLLLAISMPTLGCDTLIYRRLIGAVLSANCVFSQSLRLSISIRSFSFVRLVYFSLTLFTLFTFCFSFPFSLPCFCHRQKLINPSFPLRTLPQRIEIS